MIKNNLKKYKRELKARIRKFIFFLAKKRGDITQTKKGIDCKVIKVKKWIKYLFKMIFKNQIVR